MNAMSRVGLDHTAVSKVSLLEISQEGQLVNAPVQNNLARKPRPFSASPVASSAGLTSPFMFLLEKDDRFFPIEFQRRVARERLGKELEEIPGGHLVALSNAEGLVERLVTYEKC
jgi:hypothetical protein